MTVFSESYPTDRNFPKEWEFTVHPGPAPRWGVVRVWDYGEKVKRFADPLEIHEFFIRQWWKPPYVNQKIFVGPDIQCSVCGGHATARRIGGQSVSMLACMFCGIHTWYCGAL
jgi:hypothetical protein